MFKQLTKSIFIFLCMTFATLASAQDSPDFSAMNQAWNDAFNAQDAAAVAALYTADAQLSPGNQQVLKGTEQIQGLFQSFIDAGVHEHAIDIIETQVSGDMAYQTSTWSAKGAEVDGVTPDIGGILTNIIQRQEDGSWKTRLHIWN